MPLPGFVSDEDGSNRKMRSRISPAALLVKVSARIFQGGIPCSSILAIRRVMTVVLPEPAAARTRSGPLMMETASHCWSVRPVSTAWEAGGVE